ncbi:hypothetical protein [Pseudomonas sp. L-22-4S-12]|uniref:hypothetical protein n=1 Tax=Pseudomonas sp. L-22-4S-12 TaxID=2610893 RepID=UPI002114BD5E|nr:hypothetical protein [Pseudomonas sp. L-22-4S-12]
MVIHFLASPENAACGRTGSALKSTQNVAQVSCKLCLRSVEKLVNEPVRKTPSLAELRAAAKAEKAAVAAAEVAKPSPAMSPRAEWQQHLEQLPGRNRLPRGVSRQSFI